MSKMKREFEEQIERNYREAGLTDDTIERISKWIENSGKSNPTCKCDNCACGKSKED